MLEVEPWPFELTPWPFEIEPWPFEPVFSWNPVDSAFLFKVSDIVQKENPVKTIEAITGHPSKSGRNGFQSFRT